MQAGEGDLQPRWGILLMSDPQRLFFLSTAIAIWRKNEYNEDDSDQAE